jgi:hypothetical protein
MRQKNFAIDNPPPKKLIYYLYVIARDIHYNLYGTGALCRMPLLCLPTGLRR